MAIPVDYRTSRLPAALRAERLGDIGVLSILHKETRDALDDPTPAGIQTYFETFTDSVKAVVISSEGAASPAESAVDPLNESDFRRALERSRSLCHVLSQIQFGKVPVVAVFRGATSDGMLYLAACVHVRVAERSASFALSNDPILNVLVANGASACLQKLLGLARMTDMLLTGRVLTADEAVRIGLATYLVDDGAGLSKGLELAGYLCRENHAVCAVHGLLPS